MRLLSWLGSPSPTPPESGGRRGRLGRKPAGRQLAVEALDDRILPSFAAPVNYTVGTNPLAVVTADFNGDGKHDIAVVNNNDSTVSVLLGNGDGTFRPAVTSATGQYPHSLAVGDFNADGTLDLVTANAGDVSVLLGVEDAAGDGTGTFGPPTNIGNGSYPASVAVGDFNGDGRLDLGVVSNNFVVDGYYYGYYGGKYPFGHYDGQADVLLGNGVGGQGDGTFAAPVATALGTGYHTSATAANLNGDGFDDLVTTNPDYGTVNVLLGNGTASPQGPTDYATGGSSPQSVAVGDVNGDGIGDLVTKNYYSVSVLLGNGTAGVGDGTFRPGKATALDFYPYSTAVGDFNADGKLDLAATASAFVVDGYYYGSYGGKYPFGHYEGRVDVLLGHGGDTFGPPRESAGGGSYLPGLAAGDFDGDHFADVAVANPDLGAVSVLVNDQFWPPTPPPGVRIGDVTVAEGNTGTTNATFTVSLAYASDVDVTVHYATADGTATAGSDYTATSGDLTIPAGQTTGTVVVPVVGDRVGEANETFAVNLSAPVNGTIVDGQAVGTILDDEPRVSVNDATVTEGNTGSVTATFTVTLSFASDVAVTVHYATADGTAAAGSDYTATSGDVTIPAGQLSRTFTVAVTGDRLAESTETFAVNLSAPVNAGIADGQGTGTILDNEPRLSINGVSKKEGNGGTTQFVFTVSLSAAYDQPVTVNYSTANGTATAGSDYQAKSGTLTFAPGVKSMTVTVVVLTDKAREEDETFFVNLSGPSSNAFLLGPQGTGTILDDDTPGGNSKGNPHK